MASGCGNKTLVRIGSGNLKSLVLFIVVGLSTFMSLRGILAPPRILLRDSHFITLPARQDLPSIAAHFGANLATMQITIGMGMALMLMLFVFASKAYRAPEVLRNNLTAGELSSAAASSLPGSFQATLRKIPTHCRERSQRPTQTAWNRSASSPRRLYT